MRTSKSCILVVGSTGTGKSTLIGLCTGAVVNTSGGTAECTLDIQAFSDAACEEGPVWVDSVGFDGTDSSRSDEEAFQYILRFLQSNAISHVVGIIWTVNPDARESARLQEQAKLINKFHAGSVWRNVIIVVKKSSGNARSDGAGALAAAARYGNQEVLAVGYTLLDQLRQNEREFWTEQTPESRMRMGILTETEAKELIMASISTLPPLFQVVFRNSKCVDCGVESDARLLPLVCHVLKEQVHPESPQPFHPLTEVAKHAVSMPRLVHVGTISTDEHTSKGPNKEGITQAATGVATAVVTGSWVPAIGAVPALFGSGTQVTRVVSYWSCCSKSPDAEGCESQFPCCNQPVSNPGCQEVYQCCSSLSGSNPGCARRYPCCSGEEGSTGCRDQCSYCKVTWGTFDTNISCIGRNHQHVNKI